MNIDYDAKVATSYDTDREVEEHWALENQYVAAYFGNFDGDTILDLPVGTGRFLDSYPANASVLGVDISESMLHVAKNRIRSERKQVLQLGDGENLHFLEDKSQDCVVCFRLLHLLDSKQRQLLLKELARVAKGELLIQAYMAPNPPSMWRRVIAKGVRILRGFAHADQQSKSAWSHIRSFPITRGEFENLVCQSGLKVVACDKLCDYNGAKVEVFRLIHKQ